MSFAVFTILQVIIILIGVVAGILVMSRWLKSNPSRTTTAFFLADTILTSPTGFLFPFTKLLPSHIVGIISLGLLAIATFALYGSAGIFTITVTLSLYLNVFVLQGRSFLKIRILKPLAPTQTEPAFLLARGGTLLAFLALTILAAVRFRPPPLAPVARPASDGRLI